MWKTWILIFFLILGLIGIYGAMDGRVLMVSKEFNKPKFALSVGNNEGSSLDTSNWLTYRDREHGFSVKYPVEIANDSGNVFCSKNNWNKELPPNEQIYFEEGSERLPLLDQALYEHKNYFLLVTERKNGTDTKHDELDGRAITGRSIEYRYLISSKVRCSFELFCKGGDCSDFQNLKKIASLMNETVEFQE